ncbi:putative holliday junction resolvase [Candidatus Hakubella thermalkaliphila]|uniref:Putative pre-16S rRNA nuclease n=1 Tax=Candidatus Hakubella thermalkaliphila TaxID=2754717 RepID=A0A6V8PJ37_9ACTN|nr:Holliday junction resolvase RuvX [Candidatus Hakubella thermalkaliphila]GFP21613.1 putative holliday junction resolvase [Candidatus Hakubella thermalkaliphila]GFP28175.1 putative holliday junction resolvase [Candidatus Hakubella thermalkaliphila]GFP32313.1 putative holliday junction resolvase [Candidatus Hakubella thermalkaliphila]
MRKLALDIGHKRIGVAISDELNLVATPLEVLKRNRKWVDDLRNILSRYQVDEIIIGLPTSLRGSVSPENRKLLDNVSAILDPLGIPVRTWDERYTTTMAEKAMREREIPGWKIGKKVDMVAAAFILQNYLDYLRRGRGEKT